jgi:ubiquinone biosynthesis protein
MSTTDADADLDAVAKRAQASEWIAGTAGLADAIAEWEATLLEERSTLDAHAARLARPGPVPPLRITRHLAALQAGQLRWALQRLPRDLAGGLRPVREPATWLKDSVAYVVREQLSLLGPAAAEVARIIDASEGLAPGVIVEELRRRPVRAQPLDLRTFDVVVRSALGERVRRVVAGPLSVTPISQLHGAELTDGTRAFIRARRPGVRVAARADARITATLVAPFEQLLPAMREAHPLGFVELAARQLLEELDLRHDALNAVELGLVVEVLDRPGVVLCRPIPGLVAARAIAVEAFDGAVPIDRGSGRLDVDAVVAGLVAVTAEAALTHGVFHADLRPEQLLALPDGRVVVAGCGTIGRLDPPIRRAAIDYLAAVLGGDFEGQVAAMRAVGAVPEDVDVDALVADLRGAAALDPMAILAGGEVSLLGALREAMDLLLRHRLRPPVEVVLLVRSLFALRSLLAAVAPERSLLDALFPLIARLPELRAGDG